MEFISLLLILVYSIEQIILFLMSHREVVKVKGGLIDIIKLLLEECLVHEIELILNYDNQHT